MSDTEQPGLEKLETSFTSTTGGVLTDEVGAITGDLELVTRPTESGIETGVRYAGARDLYSVTGSPMLTTDPHQEAHQTILEKLTTPNTLDRGNELPVDLTA